MQESIGDFDDFAKTYDDLLSEALGVFGSENTFFAFRKVEISCQLFIKGGPRKILDYGCGTGLVVGHLVRQFPDAEVWGTDLSTTSLEIAKRDNPKMNRVNETEILRGYFDLIIISNVLHHVKEMNRDALLRRISTYLEKDGCVLIFEHNKLNPLTRRIVDRCEFDVGVELLTRHSCDELIQMTGLYRNINSGYFLFVPPFLKRFRFIERYLRRVPIGAQFWLTAKRLG